MVSVLYSVSNGPVRALAGALRCVLGQDTLLSQCLYSPICINGYRLIVKTPNRMLGSNLVMD